MEVKGFDSYAFTISFYLPLRNMPLMLAAKDPYVRVVAKWRLGVGV
jgi:hypothetical protein